MIGPELGVTQPGMTIVCGDSHTSTHGAFGSLAFGIGTSEVEHVLATQCLVQKRPKTMRISYAGELGPGVTAKDLILATIGRLGTGGMTGYAVEYAGPAIEALSMPGRMTVCNMTIEGGGRAGMIAPDETTFEWVRGRAAAPRDFDAAVERWRELPSDRRRDLRHRGRDRRRRDLADGHLGHQPRHGRRGRPTRFPIRPRWSPRPTANRPSGALAYMALEPGTPMTEVAPERVFIGSCTNSRIEDLREAAGGRRRAAGSPTRCGRWSCPAPSRSRRPPKPRGCDDVFRGAGFEWREAGCSMCLGMNPDTLAEGERCASTSNRNFEGRQGKGGRTHLVSPKMAAAAADRGTFRRHPGLELRDEADRRNRGQGVGAGPQPMSTPTRSSPSSS